MVEAQVGVGAIFTLTVRDEGGNIKHETAPTHNLVLNSGLDRMGQGSWITGVAVGSGNSTPSPTQTSLDAQVAWTTIVQVTPTKTLQTSVMPYYWQWEITYRFAQGVAAGNLSEIGCGWASKSMWNRALIKDINGNPTTITVLPNEFLDVKVQVRIYPPMQDILKTVNLIDDTQNVVSTHTVTIRPYLDNVSPIYSAIITPDAAISFHGGVNMRVAFASGAMGVGMFTQPSSAFEGNVQPVVTQAYVSGSNKISGYTHSDVNSHNNLHRSVLMSSRLCYFKFEYDPPISKNNTQTLNHFFELSWGRYEPT